MTDEQYKQLLDAWKQRVANIKQALELRKQKQDVNRIPPGILNTYNIAACKIAAEAETLLAIGFKLWADTVFDIFGDITIKWIAQNDDDEFDCWLDIPDVSGGLTFTYDMTE